MPGLFEDLRYTFRALIHNRGIAVIAILSLALGIGANTTIFTLMHAVLLRTLPVQTPSTLVALHTVDSRNPGLLLCSYPNYKDYRDQNQVFSSLAVYTVVRVALTGMGEPQSLMGQLVSANYFPTLGVRPVIGRSFVPEEDGAAGAAPVVVISYGLWARQFGSDPKITSRTIQLAGRQFHIVGVAPAGFRGINQLYSADLWAPMAMYPQLYPNPTWVTQRRALLFPVVGRLKPGIGMAQAEAGLQGLSRELERQFPQDNRGRHVRLIPIAQATLAEKTRSDLTKATTLLMVISGLVLLIACANIANLLLARAAGRTKEITVRLALGASRAQLVRQLLLESVLLALMGGAVAMAFARWGRDLLWSLRPSILNHADIPMELNGTILAYNILISVATGVLFGLAPAVRSTHPDLATNLKERAGKATYAAGKWNPRSVLVSFQVAFSVVALVGAGLFLRGVESAWHIDLGFNAAHLGVVAFNVADRGYSEAQGRIYQQRAVELAAGTPGVISASISKDTPFRVTAARTILLDGQEDPAAGRVTLTSVVGPGYFQTIGIPLIAGRDLNAMDTAEKPRVAIINQAAAAYFWPGDSPIGKRLHFFGDNASAEVVGVARNANYQNIGETPQALIYLSMKQYYFPTGVLYLRTAGDPGTVAAAVKHRLQTLDSELLLQSEGYDKTIEEVLWPQRLSAGLLAAFGILALLLASMGIYGVVSYSVNQRAREIGVRIALGATAGQVRRMLLWQGFRMVGVGMAVGLAVAAAGSRAVQGMLFQASPWDPATFTLVPLLLALVAFAACWVPATRVTRIDPANALRDE